MTGSARRGKWLGLLVAVLLGACGKDQLETSASVDGTLMGDTFHSRSGGYGVGTDVTALYFANVSNLCASTTDPANPGIGLSWLAVFICTGDSNPVGSYTLQTGNPGSPCTTGTACAWMRTSNATTAAIPNDATGNITISGGGNSNAQPIEGNLQLGFGDGSSFAGSFTLTYCSSLYQ